MEPLSPRSHAERVAIFRHTVIGRLLVREFVHGELRAELEALSRERFRPPALLKQRVKAGFVGGRNARGWRK